MVTQPFREMSFYKLVDNVVVPCTDMIEHAMWMAETRGAYRQVTACDLGEVRISTVFLGMDHRSAFDPRPDPLVFETAIFTEPDGVKIFGRCSTWDQAWEMHNAALRRCRAAEEEARQATDEVLKR